MPVAPGMPHARAGEPASSPFLRLHVDRVTPDLVTTTSQPMVTVSGTVTNVGDRPVHDVMVRLEHAPAVESSTGLRTTLSEDPSAYTAVADFTTVSTDLERGQSASFRLSYPLRSAQAAALAIDKPGIYPLLVNVNGTPDYGAPARLDDARFLLPVLGVPPGPTADPSEPLNSTVPPDTTHPVQMTILWPLADRPRLAAGAPGGTTPVRLVDDELAASLAGGGRLNTLLTAAEFATNDQIDPGAQLRNAMCLAVDPDLLVTVNAMTAGYVVNEDPAGGLNSPTHRGTGQAAAVEWLNRLRSLAQRMCVAPTVYAQADLSALQHVDDDKLSAAAVSGAGAIVNQILGITSVPGVTLLGDGPLTGSAVQLLSGQPQPTVAVAAAHLTTDDATGEPAAGDLAPKRFSAQVTAAFFDPSVAAALAGAGHTPISPSYLQSTLRVALDHDSPVARLQDAMSAVLWRGLQPDSQPRSQLLMPPLTWDLTGDDAQALLTTMATAIHSGLTVAHPLPALLAETAAVPPTDIEPPPDDTLGNPRAHIDDAVTSRIGDVTDRVWGLTAALTTDSQTGLTGNQFTAPLREDMLRALTQSVPVGERNSLVQRNIDTTERTVNDLFGSVTVVNPGGAYTLATERSPLPLALRNDLPVPIRVRLSIDAPPGMTVTDMGDIELPPGYLPLRVPIEVHFTQRVAVDVSLRTTNGLPLGEPVRLSVHSNAYGKVLFFITLSAGAVLFGLAGRRLWHRFRGQPDRADLDRPRARPDPLDVAIAHAPEDT
ncbi:hypothetical protein [Mycobacterium sp. MAA66]|uniref:hypothetical protein n=1 Tax=Mycobacterium sp. MAA66 TaxID=3156297 RepID=UPI0035172F4F